jgi:peptidoglycan/LPS O-acetylase OafA/YrhL
MTAASPDNLRWSARYELLDPMRGVAIIAVMLLHFCERGQDSGDELLHDRIWPVLQHGYLGVQLFFVISGYCISAALYGAMTKPQPVRHFATRRLRRIFPPYWASLVLVVVLGLATITLLNTPAATVFPLTRFDWFCNLLLIQGPLHAKDANLVYWSLSIEMQFYVVMALALFVPRAVEGWLILFSLFSLGLNHGWISPRLFGSEAWELWGTIFAYWSEFVCGIATYFWLTGRMKWRWTPRILVGLVVADLLLRWPVSGVYIQPDGRFVKSLKLLFCLACALGLILCRRYDEMICRCRPARLLRLFGMISYSLYLTHVPIGTRLFNLTQRLIGLDGLRWLIPALASCVVCTAVGFVFFRWFEKPWLNSPTSQTATTSAPAQEGVPA